MAMGSYHLKMKTGYVYAGLPVALLLMGITAAVWSAQPASRGKASWYRPPRRYGTYSCAHRTLPKGTMVLVRNLRNGRCVQVMVNDRGPFIKGRVVDLNYHAFRQIELPSRGTCPVEVRVIKASRAKLAKQATQQKAAPKQAPPKKSK